jgi:hypothetical protein
MIGLAIRAGCGLSLVLAWGVGATTAVHSHAGGGQEHCHAVGPSATGAASKTADRSRPRPGHGFVAGLDGPSPRHLHLWLLGFEFYLPLPEQSAPAPLESQGSDWFPAVSSSTRSALARSGYLGERLFTPMRPLPRAALASVISATDSRLLGRTRSAGEEPPLIPLCDRARHERSGVLQV